MWLKGQNEHIPLRNKILDKEDSKIKTNEAADFYLLHHTNSCL
jgi:carotenoid cleavage dioxygenase-like enzyme